MHKGERLNCVTHLLGLVLALVGAVFLITCAVQGGNVLKIASFSVFGLSMILLYAASTLFHSTRGPAKEHWAKADHCAIYLLIAGTYTPFALVLLPRLMGWSLFGLVWSLAVIGICKELWWIRKAPPSISLYLAMGWSGIAVGFPLLAGLRGHGWMWLLAGCLLYSLGIVFYLLDDRVRHAHGIWHLFVLGGTASHYVTVLLFIN